MDLSKLDTRKLAEQGTELTLRHPATGEPLDIAIVLLGADSKKYQAAQHLSNSKNMKAARLGKQMADVSESLEYGVIDNLAAVTLSWRNMTENDIEIPCTEENAKMIYTNYRWIADQVVAHVENRANFLPSA